MPIYEYKCSLCGHEMEAIQKMSDAPLTECPECHQSSLQKLVSPAGFQLKGTGWYVTDFKNKSQPQSDKATSTDKTTPESNTQPKKEEKTSTSGGTAE